ncbi:MAG: hypothetical protein Q9160_008484 [Pyrenula sp. 1 TL-2023]
MPRVQNLKNCIVEILTGNDPIEACKKQREKSWELLKDSQTVDKIDHLIKKAVEKGRAGPIERKEEFGDEGDPLAGHRFCEKGVKEPDQDSKTLWLWHYPYNKPANDTCPSPSTPLKRRSQTAFPLSKVLDKYPTGPDSYTAVFDAIDMSKAEKSDRHADMQWDLWEKIRSGSALKSSTRT